MVLGATCNKVSLFPVPIQASFRHLGNIHRWGHSQAAHPETRDQSRCVQSGQVSITEALSQDSRDIY